MYNPCSAYAERILSHTEHTRNEVHRMLSIHGTDFIAYWACAEMFKSRISRPNRIRFSKIWYCRPLGPYGFGFCKKVKKKISCLCTFKYGTGTVTHCNICWDKTPEPQQQLRIWPKLQTVPTYYSEIIFSIRIQDPDHSFWRFSFEFVNYWVGTGSRYTFNMSSPHVCCQCPGTSLSLSLQ